MDFGQALRAWREYVDKSQARVARRAGTGSAYLGRVERGVQRPKEITKEKIVSAFGKMSIAEFCEGPPSSARNRPLVNVLAPQAEVIVPVFKQSKLTPDWSDCGPKMMDLHVHAPGRDLIAVMVETNSMYPKVPRGSIVMVDRSIKTPEEGKIGVFWADGKAVIRRFAYAAAVGVLSLQALDPEVAPINISADLLVYMGLIWRVVADPNG